MARGGWKSKGKRKNNKEDIFDNATSKEFQVINEEHPNDSESPTSNDKASSSAPPAQFTRQTNSGGNHFTFFHILVIILDYLLIQFLTITGSITNIFFFFFIS